MSSKNFANAKQSWDRLVAEGADPEELNHFTFELLSAVGEYQRPMWGETYTRHPLDLWKKLRDRQRINEERKA